MKQKKRTTKGEYSDSGGGGELNVVVKAASRCFKETPRNVPVWVQAGVCSWSSKQLFEPDPPGEDQKKEWTAVPAREIDTETVVFGPSVRRYDRIKRTIRPGLRLQGEQTG